MFDNIAENYDFLNHLLSLGIDKYWRKQLVRELKHHKPETILDVATGTGDLAIALTETKAQKIVGVDISKKMLDEGQKKVKRKRLQNRIKFQFCDGESLAFENNSFDAVSVAFGVRNFENLDKGLAEIYRTVKTNGITTILEFSMPNNFLIRQLYSAYFFYILPFMGRFFSKNKYAYAYLPKSVKAFPRREQFLQRLQNAGFRQTRCIPLSFGIAEIYVGVK